MTSNNKDDVPLLTQVIQNDVLLDESVSHISNVEGTAQDSVPTTPVSNQNGESNDQNEIIRSPLDQRSYKSITLSNGLRVMLISTYDVPSFPEEQDATKTPCQVPEVAEFNKTYLGYDNPAARVKCACPCDERKVCCCNATKAETGSEKVCKNTLNRMHNMKAACCSKKVPESPELSTENENIQNEEASEDIVSTGLQNSVQEKNESLQAYHANIFTKLKKREAIFAKAKRTKRKATGQQYSDGTDEIYRTVSNATLLAEDLTQEFSKDTNIRRLMNSNLRNYPNPPKYTEGMQTSRTCPIESTRARNARHSFSKEFSPEMEGTVYLVIGSGYFDDPEEAPGLAHFCEHAVFLGSTKFPEPNQLFKLVLPYNGYVNAYTSGMTTTFTVSSSYKLFPLAVEILGDMVGSPLFPNTLVAAELEALDSEYSLRQDDTPKYFQLIGSLAKKGHVMRKMDSGNINTLAVPNFYRKLVEWRKIYYNPSRMTLAVEAPFPLDYLETLVNESFGKIPHPHATPIPIMTNRHLLSNGPFDMKRFHQIYHVPSVYHSEFIALHWGLDSKAWKNLKVKPLEYLGAIISHKADGGLFHYLTTQGLATNVEAGCWESDVTRNHFTSVFSISVDLTEKGFKRQDNILQAVFGYIEMLAQNRPQKYFFQELQKQQLDSFHYRAAETSLTMAESISRWMQFIPPQWCLISPTLTAELDEELIQKYTESLTIETANVIIFSKNYRGLEDTSGSMEEFYNTPYAAYYFPDELQEKINRTKEEYARNFTLPPPNPLLLNTSCSRAREKDLLRKGPLLKIKGKLSVSYVSRKVRLVRGLLPQARYSIWIGSPASSYIGALEGSSTKMLLWSQYLNEILENKFYHASTADIQMEAEVSQGELHIVVAGPSTMLPSLVQQILDIFNDFENVADPTGFEVIRSSFMEFLDNTILDNRFLAWDLFYYLWTNNHDLIFDHKRNTERMTFSTFIAFIKTFKTKMYIQTHLYGYVTKAQGQTILDALTKLEYSPVELRQYLLYRCLKLPLGERIIKVTSQNPNVHTSVVINSYQFGVLSEAEEDVVIFFAKAMSDSAFYQLRTEQQLGYIIIIYAEMTYGVSSIVVELVTQPKNFSTDYCNECIDKFLLDFYTENLSTPETFSEFSLGKPKLELPFHTIKNLFVAHLLPNPNSYRKLSIQVVGEVQDVAPVTSTKSPAEKITQAQSIFRKVSQAQVEVEHSRPPDTQGTTGRSSIDQVRAVKRSLQLQIEREKRNYSLASERTVSSKVVKHIDKFKQSLIYFPNLNSASSRNSNKK